MCAPGSALTRLIITLCFCMCTSLVLLSQAQSNRVILTIYSNGSKNETSYRHEANKIFADTLALNRYLEKYAAGYINKGYLACGFDSVISNQNQYLAFFYIGEQYLWNRVEFIIDSLPVVNHKRLRRMAQRAVTPNSMAEILRDFTSLYTDAGYPFCKARFDSIGHKAGKLDAVLLVERGDFIRFDSIVLKGNTGINPRFLARYLAFKQGEAYSNKFLNRTQALVQNSGFLHLDRPIEIAFGSDACDVILYLKKNKTSSFSGIIGFLPDSRNQDKLLLTGDLDLFLENLVGHGENLKLQWQRYQPLSQQLLASFYFPYVFKTHIGVQSSFAMQKQDSSYIVTDFRAGARYLMMGNDGFNVFFNRISSFTLSNNREVLDSQNLARVNTSLIGMGYVVNRLDYIYNPSKGYAIAAELSAGLKNADSGSGMLQEPLQWRTTAKAEFYLPLAKQISVKQALQAKAILGGKLYNNELFQTGGMHSFRGLAENSVLASSYVAITSEIRYLFERNSALIAFFDYGVVENRNTESFPIDYPMGFGMGINLQTRAGIFSLAYAMGREKGNPIDLKSSKIHFGYINRF